MSARSLVLVAAALSCVSSSIPMAKAETTTRAFFNPAHLGKPVALCMSDRASCGKPTADAWCRDQGFGEALTFERLRVADKSQIFRQIKCIIREEAVAVAAGELEKATP